MAVGNKRAANTSVSHRTPDDREVAAGPSPTSTDLSDSSVCSTAKVPVYIFEENRLTRMSKRELYRKAENGRNVETIDIPARPGRLPIRLKEDEKDSQDRYIAGVNLKWSWRLRRWVGSFKVLYVVGSI